MSTRVRSTLTLLTSAAMLCVWSGTAAADDTLPLDSLVCEVGVGADCETTPAPPVEPRQTTEDPLVAGPEEEGAGDGDVPATVPEPLETFSTEDLGLGSGTTTDDGPTTEESSGAAGTPPGSEDGGEAPDPAEFGTCVEAALTDLIAGLEAEFGESVGDLVTEIQESLTPEALLDPATIPALLAGLPAMGEDTVEGITGPEALLTEAAAALQKCLPAAPAPPAEEEPTSPAGPQQPASPAVHYENCDDARAQGAAPVHADEPGYRPALDSDSDGIGCEEAVVVTAPVQHQSHTTGTLAYTGFELGPQLAVGGVLLLLGSSLLLAARRRA